VKGGWGDGSQTKKRAKKCGSTVSRRFTCAAYAPPASITWLVCESIAYEPECTWVVSMAMLPNDRYWPLHALNRLRTRRRRGSLRRRSKAPAALPRPLRRRPRRREHRAGRPRTRRSTSRPRCQAARRAPRLWSRPPTPPGPRPPPRPRRRRRRGRRHRRVRRGSSRRTHRSSGRPGPGRSCPSPRPQGDESPDGASTELEPSPSTAFRPPVVRMVERRNAAACAEPRASARPRAVRTSACAADRCERRIGRAMWSRAPFARPEPRSRLPA
jgi:hypothetical protein